MRRPWCKLWQSSLADLPHGRGHRFAPPNDLKRATSEPSREHDSSSRTGKRAEEILCCSFLELPAIFRSFFQMNAGPNVCLLVHRIPYGLEFELCCVDRERRHTVVARTCSKTLRRIIFSNIFSSLSYIGSGCLRLSLKLRSRPMYAAQADAGHSDASEFGIGFFEGLWAD